jgi:hypothetical protein
MTETRETQDLFAGRIEIDGRSHDITVSVEFDGIEHVGHLWFTDSEWDDDDGVRDRGSIPGRSPAEVLAHARELTASDLTMRYRRAVAEQRRHHGLRKLTDDVLDGIRHLNKVATSMRAGLLDIDEAASEIAETEQRLHVMISQLRNVAGVLV